MSNISDYQVDHLLLLVGSNPLPNAVAGKLLVAADGMITLIHSQDSCALAKRLRLWLLYPETRIARIDLIEVEESDATSVCRGVEKALKTYESSNDAKKRGKVCVGLHYTGGTKVMSVHAYRVLENWARSAKNQEREAVFSYLDAHTLRMRFDETPGKNALSFSVGLNVEIGIEALIAMHGWEWKQGNVPHTAPVLPESAAALLTTHSNASEAGIWTEWLHQELFPATRKSVVVSRPFQVFDESGKELQGSYVVKQPAPDDQWKNKPDLTLPWPNQPTLTETLQKELGQGGVEKLNLKVEKASGLKDEKAFCRWLSGTWLESAVLSALQNCSEELELRDCCMNLELQIPGENEGGFEFDVVAIRGYQLFAFSCTTVGDSKGSRGLLKHKLFELYIRARQMGGDEACAALVCCMEQRKADRLEQEVRYDLGSEGRIRIFGREKLANLSGHIANWIHEQSKER